MPSILTVDDDDVTRATIARFVEGMGFQVAQASDGSEGLAILEECKFDLVILDMMMPGIDGPGMLARMRARGDGTPVIMLTAESRRPLVLSVMRSGIVDYVMKPFQFDELRRKILLVIQRDGGADVVVNAMPGGAPAAGLREGRPRSSYRPVVDVLVVDDMQNVWKRLRAMFPPRFTLEGVTSAQSAVARAAEKMFRVVLIDAEIPGIDSGFLAQQVRELQPHALVAAMAMRADGADQGAALKEQGFAAVLHKPFVQDDVDDLVGQYLERQEYVSRDGDLLRLAPFVGRPRQRESYFNGLSAHLATGLKEVAGACFGAAVVDCGNVPSGDELLPKLIATAAVHARTLGVDLRVVGREEVRSVLASYEETRSIPCFESVEGARAAA